MKNKKRFLLFTTLPCLPIATGAAIGLTSCTNQAPKYDPECRYKTKDGKFEVRGNMIYDYLLNNSNEELNKYSRNGHAELIPNEVELDIGKKVTIDTIGESSLASGDKSKFKLDAIIIQDGIKYIEQWAFNNNNITNVFLPDSIEKIEYGSFENNKIDSIKLSNNSKFVSIPGYTFFDFDHRKNNIYIKNIDSLYNVKYVGNSAFSGFNTDNLDFFTKSRLEYIGSSSFDFYPIEKEIKTFEFPNTLKGVAEYCVTLPKVLNDKIYRIIKDSNKTEEVKTNEIKELINISDNEWKNIKICREPENGEEPIHPDFPYVLDENQPKSFLEWFQKVVFLEWVSNN